MPDVSNKKDLKQKEGRLFSWDKLAYVGYLLMLMGFVLGFFYSIFAYLVAVGLSLVVLGSILYWLEIM